MIARFETASLAFMGSYANWSENNWLTRQFNLFS